MPQVSVTHFTDPGCPWAYSGSPALAALAWRYGDQLEWRHVLIGLTEERRQYADRGYTPLMMAGHQVSFRRYGMPFAPIAKEAVAATSRACRAIVAVRLQAPEQEWAALRALQWLQFTTPDVLDDDAALERALAVVPGIDPAAIVGAIDSPDVKIAYGTDRGEARQAEGTPAHAQDKTADSDGPVRYTAPSLIFEQDGRRLIAGGFQSLAAYDVLLANLDPTLERRGAPEDVGELWAAFPFGLTTAEVAEILAQGTGVEPDLDAAEVRLIESAADGTSVRVGLGDGALWIGSGTEAADSWSAAAQLSAA